MTHIHSIYPLHLKVRSRIFKCFLFAMRIFKGRSAILPLNDGAQALLRPSSDQDTARCKLDQFASSSTNGISQVHAIAKQVGLQLKQHHLQLATAESCTGGQLAQTITAIPGSSEWFERGFITYSTQSKQELLDVSKSTLERYGPSSQETAEEMAKGVLKKSPAAISIAITGIAGPEGGTKEKPVGTIYFAWASKSFCKSCVQHFAGDRLIIRYAAVEFALKELFLIQKSIKR